MCKQEGNGPVDRLRRKGTVMSLISVETGEVRYRDAARLREGTLLLSCTVKLYETRRWESRKLKTFPSDVLNFYREVGGGRFFCREERGGWGGNEA